MNVAKTLDLMKAVLQASFNMELKRLCDDYFSCFRQAATNIRENTGDDVPEATLRLLVCKMLEEVSGVGGAWRDCCLHCPLPLLVALCLPLPLPLHQAQQGYLKGQWEFPSGKVGHTHHT